MSAPRACQLITNGAVGFNAARHTTTVALAPPRTRAVSPVCGRHGLPHTEIAAARERDPGIQILHGLEVDIVDDPTLRRNERRLKVVGTSEDVTERVEV